MAFGSCKYQLRTLPCGTEADGVTLKRHTYVTIVSGTSRLFTDSQLDLVTRTLEAANIAFTYRTQPQTVNLQHIGDMLAAQTALERAGLGTKDQVPYFVWKWIRDYTQQPALLSESDVCRQLGEDLWAQLHPYQRICVQRATACKRFYLGDEMGTGKTLQCLATCRYFRDQWPVLVFCPSSMRYTWRSEIVRWLGLPNRDVLVVKNTQHYLRNYAAPHCFLVLSYSLLTNQRVVDLLRQRRYNIVVFDEAHYVKSMYSKRSNQACAVATDADVKLLLSGTPFNYPSEMYQQIKILHPQLYPRFFNYNLEEDRCGEYHYAKRYCKPAQCVVRGKSVWSFRGYDNHEELTALFDTFMLRRRKADILTQLPAKNRICITLDPLPATQAKEIKTLLQTEPTSQPTASYMEAFRLTSTYKIANVVRFIKEHILEDHLTNNPEAKALIFFHHQAMQHALENVLTLDAFRQRFPYFVIAGTTAPSKRDEYKDAFQTTDRYRIGLLSITAAGVGLTLTAATTEVFTEVLFGPNDHLQAEDRAHRLGQKSVVNIFYLLQPHTTDDVNFNLIRTKERESSRMLDGQATLLPSHRVPMADLDGTTTLQQLVRDTPKRSRDDDNDSNPTTTTITRYVTQRTHATATVYRFLPTANP